MTSAWNNFTDQELAWRALAGGAACYEELVRRHQVPLMRFLMKRFPSRRDAEDILQEALLKAWQSLHRYDAQFEFRTWLYTIAYRLAVSHGRRKEETEPLPEFDARSSEASPESAAERQDEHQSIWRKAREILSDEQYMILWLHYVDDVPAPDIAKLLNRSWVSVKTLLHRARKKLMPYVAEGAPILVTSQPVMEAGEP